MAQTNQADINELLLKVQAGLKAPKGQFNKFGGYSYRSCEDILEAAKPLLSEQGLTLTLQDEPIIIGDWHYIKASAFVRKGEQLVISTAYAREPKEKKGMDEAQITGSTSSYARKYALNGLFLIDDSKDPDTMDNSGSKKPKQPEQKGFNKKAAWGVIQEFARNTGLDAKTVADGITKREEYQDTDEFWAGIIKEFSR